MEKIKEVVKKHRVLMGIAICALLVVFYADTWQQNRFAIADKAYMMMNKQEYTEAAGLMEQYLDISWQPYWKAIELVNGKSDKFTRAEAETALERCMEKIKEE
jgi:hypothetical protein